MLEKNKKEAKVIDLINGAFDSTVLREKFYDRITYLGISITEALEILEMQSRTLAGILNGTQQMVNILSLKKMSVFLHIEEPELMSLYLQAVENHHKDDLELFRKKAFIDSNFDLVSLKKIGFIDNLLDYNHIENRIISHFGFNSIYEYGKINVSATFSNINKKSKDAFNKFFWVESCYYQFKKIQNPYPYDKDEILKYIPKIRWHSTLTERGLFQVIRVLYTLGVTVIFKPYVPSLLVRGATMCVNDKPCIALTNFTKYYSTAWFTLMHEIYHILFHFDQIKENKAHISSEKATDSKEEIEADDFAKEYLFSDEKMDIIKTSINDMYAVKNFAKLNQVHESIIYAFYCYERQGFDKKVWSRFLDKIPDINLAYSPLPFDSWDSGKSVKETATKCNLQMFNI
jgi:hypothetical protein